MPLPEHLTAALASRYVLRRELGSGGMATVYLADDLKHHRQVAIKVLKPQLAAVLGAERFLREIEITASLHHPHILPLFDSGPVAPLATLFYVMPYVDGESLRHRLRREPRLPIEEALRIAREAADALSYAHGQRVIHRDIKPENILLDSGHAVVADFGIARAISAAGAPQLTNTGISVGTPAYMSPEQAAGARDLDARSDLYSLGCVLYEMITGATPYGGDSPREVLARGLQGPPDLTDIRRAAPAVAALLERMLALDPDDRFPSLAAFIEGLDALPPAHASSRRTRAVRYAATAAIGVAAAAGGWIVYHSRVQAVDLRLLARAEQLADSGQPARAFLLARHPPPASDSATTAEWSAFARRATVITAPAGARVWWRPHATDDTTWRLLGVTPIRDHWFPRAYIEARLDRDGFASLHGLRWLYYGADTVRLFTPDQIPKGMVPVGGGKTLLRATSLERLPTLTLPPYFIDRYEVTNRRFKAFVDAGGYADSTWWPPFERDGRRIPWSEARRAFVDQTGRPGPATWVLGTYPEGRADYPVGGVSWFEAAAFARFSGKSLPSIYHWYRAAGTWATSWISPASNLGGSQLLPVGHTRAVSPWGAYDVAGNVREWCWNATGNERFILGGAWNDATTFESSYARSPWNRAAENGLRLAQYPETTAVVRRALGPIERSYRDYEKERPVSDEPFAVFRRLYDFDPRPLDPSVEAVDTTERWIRQRVTVRAAYGDERLPIYVYLPRQAKPPYQTVVFFPGSGALFQRSFDANPEEGIWDYLVRGGRALVFPIYWGTFERDRGISTDQPDTTDAYRDRVRYWARDFRRAVGYAASRPDLDSTRLAFLGYSWGARLGPLLVALEPRIKVAVLYVGGLKLARSLPEVDPFDFAPRVHIPVLMLNGRYDFWFPVKTSQDPLYRLLGTPADAKRHVVYDGSHFVPRVALVREVTDWFDRWLGTVDRGR